MSRRVPSTRGCLGLLLAPFRGFIDGAVSACRTEAKAEFRRTVRRERDKIRAEFEAEEQRLAEMAWADADSRPGAPTRRPTEDDWRSEPWCLDAESAYEKLNGRSSDEIAAATLASGAGFPWLSEHLMFMPQACFAYVLSAGMKYLEMAAEHGELDWLDLMSFASTVSHCAGYVVAVGPEFQREVENCLRSSVDLLDPDVQWSPELPREGRAAIEEARESLRRIGSA